MMDKMNRRAFLKSAGTVALAVAAAGVLTACGEDAPVPITFEISKLSSGRMHSNTTNKDYALIYLTVKNTGAVSFTVSTDNFTVKLDGGTEQKTVGLYEVAGLNMSSAKSKELKAGESASLAVSAEIDNETYNTWLEKEHNIDLIAHIGGNNRTLSFKQEKPQINSNT